MIRHHHHHHHHHHHLTSTTTTTNIINNVKLVYVYISPCIIIIWQLIIIFHISTQNDC
jgi:hypothetical protein